MRNLLARLRGQAIAITALCIALGGTSYAAVKLPKDSVSGAQIKSGAVSSSEVKNGSLTGTDVKNKSLTAADFTGSVKGATGATGQPGAPGAQGRQGDQGQQGVAGTARAYAYVSPDGCSGTNCEVSLAKGVSAVTHPSAGTYCVTAPGLDTNVNPAIVSPENSGTTAPAPATDAQWRRDSLCGGQISQDTYKVVTERLPVIGVRNAADTGTETVIDNAVAPSDTVAFVIAIP